MKSAPRKEKRAVGSALKTAERLVAYHALAFLANLFAGPFWFFEKRRWQLADWLDNQRSGHP
jgi:hypothetical protein